MKLSTMRKSRAQHGTPPPRKQQRYRIRNWPEYNRALIRRGSLTLWFDRTTRRAWRAPRTKRRGDPMVYSDVAILCMATLQVVYHLPLRATQGLLWSLTYLLDLRLPVPDYATVSRRRRQLSVPLPRQWAGEPLHLVIDSTGLKIYGAGEWRVRQHGWTKHRVWRTVHLGVDEASSEVVACVVTKQTASDHGTLPQVLNQVDDPVTKASLDTGYDYNEAYALLVKRGAEPVILPRRNAVVSPLRDWTNRNRVVQRIAAVGRDQWKHESGYHRRSIAENAIFRLKTLFGDRLTARAAAGQAVEAQVRCAALNRMTHQGMPESYPVPG